MKVETQFLWSPQMVGKTIFIDNEVKIFVQDVGEQQNSNLFEEGLNLITNKVTPKRRDYIEKMLRLVLPTIDMGLEDTLRKSRDIGHLIAFVCDIALHKNKRLAHPDAYHKDFNLINCYNEKILPIFNYQLTIQKEIQKLTDLRDRLLPLLMNGQVEVEG